MVLFSGNYRSSALTKSTLINVILPADNKDFLEGSVDDVRKPYRTLYLLHGMFGNCDTFPANTVIQEFAELNHLAVVLPSCDNSFYIDRPEEFLYYSRYVGEELVDFTRSVFPLSDRREDTYIAGFSMGGYGAIRTGLLYSDRFSVIGAIAPALISHFLDKVCDDFSYIMNSRQYFESIFGSFDSVRGSDKDPEYLVNCLLDRDADIPDIYMAVGEDDFLKPVVLDFYDFLKDSGVFVDFCLDEGFHSWDFCNDHIKRFISWLVGR